MSTAIRDQLRQTLINDIAPSFRVGVELAVQRQLLDSMGAAAALPEGLEIDRRELAGLPCEWLTPSEVSEGRALLHLHGGGFVMGSCASHRGLTSQITAACAAVGILPEYRLAPEAPFPAALDDALAAYRALLAGGQEPGKLVLLGDSAGGGLVLSLLVALRDAGDPLPAAAVLLSPYVDLTGSGESTTSRAAVDPWLNPEILAPMREHYRGAVDPADPRISPLFADLEGLPPLIVQVGDHEILLADSTRLAERGQAAGVAVDLEVWPELWHVFQLFAPLLPEANAAIAKIGAKVGELLGGQPAA